MTFLLDKYKESALASNHSNEFISETIEYANFLSLKNLPVLFALPHLCLASAVSIKNTLEICNSSRIEYYKRFKIKKRRGGYRTIQTPTNELKYLQKWILRNILEKVPSHKSCTGFDKSSSIKKNAEIHLNAECILKIDLLRFFDSINERRIYGIFKSFGYQNNLCVSLAKICTIKQNETFYNTFKKNEDNLKQYLLSKDEGILPQGAPTSPKLANLILRNLDKRLERLCSKYNVNYSRYADDLTFSGKKEDLVYLKKIIYKVIYSENLFVNFGKTKFLVRGNSYFVTGLSVHNNEVKVIKRKKKEIEHHLYHCIKNGVMGHLNRSKIKNRNFKDWLYGNICFIFSIEQNLGQEYFNQFNKIDWPL